MAKNLQKMNFTGKIIFVGLDVHLKTWHATILFGQEAIQKSFGADAHALNSYLTNTYPGATYKVAYEAGYTGFWVHEALTALGMDVIVINPADVPTTDKEARNKTDIVDSRKIAFNLKAGLLKGNYVMSREAYEDRELIRQRKTLGKDLTRIKNRIKSNLAFHGIKMPEEFDKPSTHWSEKYVHALGQIKFKKKSGEDTMQCLLRYLDFLKSEIRTMNNQIKELSKSEHYKRNCEILMSVPGIGLLSSMILLTEIHDIKRFSHPDKLLSYFGIMPTEHSSGGRTRKGWLTTRKNNYLRKMIVESAWVAKTKDPTLSHCYNEAYKRSEPGRAIIKVAKKLIVRLYRIWTHEEQYVMGMA